MIYLLLLFVSASLADTCEEKSRSLYDSNTRVLNCPEPGDPSHFSGCCGPSWDKTCCAESDLFNRNNDFDFDDFDDAAESVVTFILVGLGIVLFVVVVSVILCCCLPCCFLAKRRTRNRGIVHRPGTTPGGQVLVTTTNTGYPSQPEVAPLHPQGVPVYPQGGPAYTQGGPVYPPGGPAYPPGGQAYPPGGQAYPQGGPAYPPQGLPAGYPSQPPPYSGPTPGYQTKQDAYNPNL